MPDTVVEVAAPSRLHFGMFSFGQAGVRQFGGVGVMIGTPGVRVRISPAPRLEAAGPHSLRVAEFARRAAAHRGLPEPACRIEVTAAPRPHVGLGSGTALALAVAAGLNAFLGGPPSSPADLALSTGRGARSAIGLYGFAQGGLLVEAGKLPDESISPLVARVELPAAWRFVLVCPADRDGLSGGDERRAFERLRPVAAETTSQLCRLALLGLLPAAAAGRFDEFSDSLYQFNRLVGTCFADWQGGPFASPELVERVRRLGAPGVAQSSWGPTLAALVPDEAAATSLVGRLRREPGLGELELTIAAPENRGASIVVADHANE